MARNLIRWLFALLFLVDISLVGLAQQPLSIHVVKAFPNLTFQDPLYLAAPPDGTNRLFVVEQDGRLWWFENSRPVTARHLALDLSHKVRRSHMEEGFLGLAFHPKFKTNRYLFLNYSATPRRNVISRFQMDSKRETVLPGSEVVILEQPQPYGNHNGGMLDFGPDGDLYISFGDGGSAGDPHNNGQSLATWLGKILRIDVDKKNSGRPYSVPPDNPFVSAPEARPEIWAYGLRNPWRFSFDRRTGDLWAGDVGQDAWEEIDLIKRGGNYGWSLFEGNHRFKPSPHSSPVTLQFPVVEHERNVAQSITGGYVYRGKKFPELRGSYIYGDFMTGNIWILQVNGKTAGGAKLIAKSQSISSFGEDEEGEIYFTSFDGSIYTFEK